MKPINVIAIYDGMPDHSEIYSHVEPEQLALSAISLVPYRLWDELWFEIHSAFYKKVIIIPNNETH
jgi:hypothetical protein